MTDVVCPPHPHAQPDTPGGPWAGAAGSSSSRNRRRRCRCGWRSATGDCAPVVPSSPSSRRADEESAVGPLPSCAPGHLASSAGTGSPFCLWRCDVSLRKSRMWVRLALPRSGLTLLPTRVSGPSILENPWPFTLRMLPLPRAFLPSRGDPQEPGRSPWSSTPPTRSWASRTPFWAARWAISGFSAEPLLFSSAGSADNPAPRHPGDACPPRRGFFHLRD